MSKREGIYKVEYTGLRGFGYGGLVILNGVASGVILGVRLGGSYREVKQGLEVDLALQATEDFESVTGIQVDRGDRPLGKFLILDSQLNGEMLPLYFFKGQINVTMKRLSSF